MFSHLQELCFLRDGRKISYAMFGGPGEPILFLHGVGRNWQTFSPLFQQLAPVRTLIGVTFRGHGHSDRTPKSYLVMDYVGDLVAFLEQQVRKPVTLYGHSLGAMVALAVAAQASGLVKSLILEDPPFDTMGNQIHESPLLSYFSGIQTLAGQSLPVIALARKFADLPLYNPRTGLRTRVRDTRDQAGMRLSARFLKSVDPDVFTSIVSGNWLSGYDRNHFIRRVQIPTLLLQADPHAGGMLSDDDANELETTLTDCTRVKLEGVPHLMHWARTQEVLNLVSAFLNANDSSDSTLTSRRNADS